MKSRETKNIIFISLFFCALILNVIAVVKPDNLERGLVIFLPIPILVIRYYDLTKSINISYMISFAFIYFGAAIYASRISNYFSISVILYLLGILLYVKILLDKISFTKKHVIQFTGFLLLLLALPIFYVYNKVSVTKLFFMIIYVSGILLYFYTSILLVKKKVYNSKYLLISSSLYIISTTCTALLIFNRRTVAIRVLATLSFWTVHLLMNLYMTSEKDTKENGIYNAN